jgi:hypothetical protein
MHASTWPAYTPKSDAARWLRSGMSSDEHGGWSPGPHPLAPTWRSEKRSRPGRERACPWSAWPTREQGSQPGVPRRSTSGSTEKITIGRVGVILPKQKALRATSQDANAARRGRPRADGVGVATVIWIGRSLPPHIPRAFRAGTGGDSAGAAPTPIRAAAHGEPRVRVLLCALLPRGRVDGRVRARGLRGRMRAGAVRKAVAR